AAQGGAGERAGVPRRDAERAAARLQDEPVGAGPGQAHGHAGRRTGDPEARVAGGAAAHVQDFGRVVSDGRRAGPPAGGGGGADSVRAGRRLVVAVERVAAEVAVDRQRPGDVVQRAGGRADVDDVVAVAAVDGHGQAGADALDGERVVAAQAVEG